METFKLSFPLKYYSVDQKFGENANSYYAEMGLKGHDGLDLHASNGTEVFAAHDGRVVFAGYDSAGGLGIRIRTEETYEYNNQTIYPSTIYWHLKKDTLKVTGGQLVKKGDLIALSNNTGRSSGPHLHFALQPLKREANMYDFNPVDPNNGYRGYIDPTPYLPPIKTFSTKLSMGDSGFEVEKVQAFLLRQGFMAPLPPGTSFGYYGALTRAAVFKFQQKYCDLSLYERTVMKGNTIGEKTLAALNKLNDSV